MGPTSSTSPPSGGWEDAETASRYARFAREFPMYEATSRDVVHAARIKEADRVLDLCCGTGVTSESILSELSSEGRVVGVDASAAMLAEARAWIDDPRLALVQAPAEDLEAAVTGTFQSAVCNSAIWQTEMDRVFRAMTDLLDPGGRFAFNINRRFLIAPFTADELGQRPPDLHDLTWALAVLEHGFVPGRAGVPNRVRSAPLTPEGVVNRLERAGFERIETDWVEYEMTARQRAEWLSIPVFANQTPGRTPAEKREILDEALRRLGEDHVSQSKWFLVSATKPA